ncbi:hypothetical protein [Mucilaginibacter segetis]|uniref:Uncharacterized protein n=1 Tax=Mucilaginibacter segetis TaxID=2793071 RepID=A0A934UMQ1_9SPHI|nr:hypothetical protein [Mucilaginibacter segetis]MBK0379614.1 hypothetical protein [Mucilaginibacter segetis]
MAAYRRATDLGKYSFCFTAPACSWFLISADRLLSAARPVAIARGETSRSRQEKYHKMIRVLFFMTYKFSVKFRLMPHQKNDAAHEIS